ncbi:MAG: serine/threonine protein kinase [Alphaproteobacteria bacterium]|nr:serine/threonine protein kinase [Alphaproteobacteria bacterium]
MDLHRYQRAHELFEQLADAPISEQADALARVSGEDAELGQLLSRLLALDQAVDSLVTLDGDVASAVVAEAVGAVPTDIAGMEVIRELGRGGMGVVYEAQQRTPRRRVALKTLPPLRDTARLREQLRAEVEALAKVEHPGVPRVYQLLEHEGMPVLSMELVRGRRLNEHASGLGLKERVALLIGITEAIVAAHDQGVIHRDLKPGNVLVTDDGQVKVLDFGIAALEGEDGVTAGTPGWCAPEQLLGGQTSKATDVYGLAAVGWALVTGGPPEAPPEGPLPRPAEMPRPLYAVLSRALSRQPEDRYPDARALLEDLQRYARDRVVSPLARDPRARLGAALRRHRSLAALSALALVAVGIFGLLGFIDQNLQRGRARHELSAVQQLSEQLGVASPEVHEAFRTLVGSPRFQGMPEVHEAWRWCATQPGCHPAAAGMAWVTAPNAEARRRAAVPLARYLAEHERWAGLAVVMEDLPPHELPELRRAVASQRWDPAALEPLLDARERPLLGLLTQAEPILAAMNGKLLEGGYRAMQTARDTLVVQDAEGQEVLRWQPSKGQLTQMTAAPDGALWVNVNELGTIFRWAPGDAAPVAIETHGRIADTFFADLDADGIMERYTSRFQDSLALLVAEPPEGPSHEVEGVDLEKLRVWVRNVVGPGAQGEAWLAVKGWGASGVLRVEGLPDHARITGRLRVFPDSLVELRRPGQVSELVVVGLQAGSSPSRLMPSDTPQRIARVSRERTPRPTAVETPPFRGRGSAADLDGDGWDDLVLALAEGTHVRREGPEGTSDWLSLPGLEVMHVGQADADPADELWVRTPEQAWILGVQGAPPLPVRALEPLPEPFEPPEVIKGQARVTWDQLERLVGVQLGQEAAARFEELGTQAGESGLHALLRALTLYSSAEDRARVASQLAYRPLAPEDKARVRAVLVEVHDREGLAHLDAAPAAETFRLGAEDDLEGWRVLTPEGVRLLEEDGLAELRLHASRGAALELPLSGGEGGVAVELDFELQEMEFGSRLELELVAEGWSAHVSLGRGHGAAWGTSLATLRCAAGEAQVRENYPMDLGPRRLRLSWLREAGTLRCSMDDEPATSVPLPEPPGGPLRLRLQYTDTHGGVAAGRLLWRGLSLRGATPAPLPTADDRTRMVHGDAAAAARVVAGDDPVAALEARRVLGLPLVEALRASPEATRVLLRLRPGEWLPVAAEALGDSLSAAVAEAWILPLECEDPWTLPLVLSAQLRGARADSESERILVMTRASALIQAGRLIEADRLLAPLRAQGLPSAWRITALLEDRRGDPEATQRALTRWLELSPRPETDLEVSLRDPSFGPLVSRSMPLPPSVD